MGGYKLLTKQKHQTIKPWKLHDEKETLWVMKWWTSVKFRELEWRDWALDRQVVCARFVWFQSAVAPSGESIRWSSKFAAANETSSGEFGAGSRMINWTTSGDQWGTAATVSISCCGVNVCVWECGVVMNKSVTARHWSHWRKKKRRFW